MRAISKNQQYIKVNQYFGTFNTLSILANMKKSIFRDIVQSIVK